MSGYPGAVVLFVCAILVSCSVKSRKDYQSERISHAIEAIKNGSYDDAIEILEEEQKRDPENEEIAKNLSIAHASKTEIDAIDMVNNLKEIGESEKPDEGVASTDNVLDAEGSEKIIKIIEVVKELKPENKEHLKKAAKAIEVADGHRSKGPACDLYFFFRTINIMIVIKEIGQSLDFINLSQFEDPETLRQLFDWLDDIEQNELLAEIDSFLQFLHDAKELIPEFIKKFLDHLSGSKTDLNNLQILGVPVFSSDETGLSQAFSTKIKSFVSEKMLHVLDSILENTDPDFGDQLLAEVKDLRDRLANLDLNNESDWNLIKDEFLRISSL